MEVRPEQVLIDAPPFKLEVQFEVDIYDAKQKVYRKLEDVSPVVKTLATTQFNDYVKRVRVFVDPSIIANVRAIANPVELLQDAVAAAG